MKRRPFELVHVNDQMSRVMVARFPIASVFYHRGAKGRLPRGFVYVLGQFGRVSEMHWPACQAGFKTPIEAGAAALGAWKRKRKNLSKKYRDLYFSVYKKGKA